MNGDIVGKSFDEPGVLWRGDLGGIDGEDFGGHSGFGEIGKNHAHPLHIRRIRRREVG